MSHRAVVAFASTCLIIIILFVFRRYLNLSKFQYNAYSCLGVMILLLSIISFFSLSFSTVVDRLSAYASPLLIFAASESPAVLKDSLAHSLVVGSIVIYSFLLTLAWLSASYYAINYWIPIKIFF